MSQPWQKIAAVLALLIGVMAVFAGGKVLLGEDPGYYVINWVPVYNYTAGILTMAVTAPLIFRGHRLARPLAIATLGAHAAVLVVIATAYRDVVAQDSIRAMVVRLAVWLIIIGLLYTQARRRHASVPGGYRAVSTRPAG